MSQAGLGRFTYLLRGCTRNQRTSRRWRVKGKPLRFCPESRVYLRLASPYAQRKTQCASCTECSYRKSRCSVLLAEILSQLFFRRDWQTSSCAQSQSCSCSQFPEGELRQIRIAPTSDGAGEGAILLTKVDGKFYVLWWMQIRFSRAVSKGRMLRLSLGLPA